MIDLIETFAEARFGKQAATPPKEGETASSPFQQLSAYFSMPQLTPDVRKIRDMLEHSVKEEKRLKQRAGKATEYARYRLGKAQKAGTLGWLEDIVRAAMPGLSITAADGEGIVKEGVEPEKALPGRAFDMAHLAAGLGGAGIGGAAGAGMLGGVPGAARLKDVVDKKKLLAGILGEAPLSKETGELLKRVAKGGDIALAAQRDIPYVTRVTEKASPTWWRKRLLDPSAPRTAEAARAGIRGSAEQALSQQITAAQQMKDKAVALLKLKGLKPEAGLAARKQINEATAKLMGYATTKKQLGEFFSQLSSHAAEVKAHAVSAARRAAGAKGIAYKLKGKGKLGAIVGAILAMSPFVLARLFKTRRLRARGGTAAEAAAEKAQEALAQAGKLKSWREQQLAQLAGVGDRETRKLLPLP